MERDESERGRALRPRRPMAGEDLAHRAESEERFPQHGGTRRDVMRGRPTAQELLESSEL
jgi:hypothetical protein